MSFQPPLSMPRRQTGLLGTIVGAARSAATLPQDIVGTVAARVRATPPHIVDSLTRSREALRQYRQGTPPTMPRARQTPELPQAPEAEPLDLGPLQEGLDSGAPWLTNAMALPYGQRNGPQGAPLRPQTLIYPYASARAPRRLLSLRS